MNNDMVDGQNLFGRTLKGLRRKTGLTQEQMAEASGGLFRIDSLRRWEGNGDYLSLENLKNLLSFFLKRNTLSPGKEREEARDLWEKATQRFTGLAHVSFDENWFAEILAEAQKPKVAVEQISSSSSSLDNGIFPNVPGGIVQLNSAPEVPQETTANPEQINPVSAHVHSDSPSLDDINQLTPGNKDTYSSAFSHKLKPANSLLNLIRKPLVIVPVIIVLLGLLILLIVLLPKNNGPDANPALLAVSTNTAAIPTQTSIAATPGLPALFVFKDSLKDDNFLKEAIYCLSFSANSKTLASVSGNSKINFWRVNANGAFDRTPIKSLTGFQTGLKDRASWVVYSKDGKRLAVASGSRDSTAPQKWEIGIWEVDADGLPKTDQPFQRINPGAEHVPAFGFSYDGKLIASPGPSNSVILWDVDSGKQLINLTGHAGLAREFSFSQDSSQLVVASGDGTVKLWDVKTGTVLKTFDSHEGGAWTATFSPDGKVVASGGKDKAVVLSDAESGKKIDAFVGKFQDGESYSVTFSPNGKVLATAGFDGNVILWDVATGVKLQELKGSIVINNLAFSPDGRFLAIGTDNSDNIMINLWQVLDNSKTK